MSIYFVYKPGVKHYVFLFDNTGKRVGVLRHEYAWKVTDNSRIITTFERINVIRKLNGMKEVKI